MSAWKTLKKTCSMSDIHPLETILPRIGTLLGARIEVKCQTDREANSAQF